MNLVEKINFFYKKAGLVKFSNTMKQEILEFVKSEFLSWKPIIKEKNKNKEDYKIQGYTEVDIVVEDLNYKNPLLDHVRSILNTLSVRVVFTNLNTESLGVFNQEDLNITLYVKVKNNKIDIDQIATTIEHELMHLTQYLLSLTTKSKSNKLRFDEEVKLTDDVIKKIKKFNPDPNQFDIDFEVDAEKAKRNISLVNNIEGTPKEFDYKKYKELALGDGIMYAQLNNEFFTLLNDAIADFKSQNNNSKEYFKKFINGNAGNNRSKIFFKDIKYNKKLYERAIKEMYKQVNLE